MKKIILTGGGTAGHVTPNMALIPDLKRAGWEVHYIGTKNSIEEDLISPIDGVFYHTIKSGKLRRYFDIKNFTDPFRVLAGIGQSLALVKKIGPKFVFSKGGFVSVPVVIGGWMNRVPVMIHESDLTPGLANKIAGKFAKKICATFPETMDYLPREKAVHTGTPIRPELFKGEKKKGLTLCDFAPDKPVILVMGGSLGSLAINNSIRSILDRLTKRFSIVHICGRGHLDERLEGKSGYRQFEYVSEDLAHLMAMANIIISRAGANSIYEFLALKKPSLLIPLPLSASRGDQILNARSFQRQGFSKILMQENMTDDTLYESIMDLQLNRDRYIKAMNESDMDNSIDLIFEQIDRLSN